MEQKMNYDEFKESVKDTIKHFLPEKYEDADVSIKQVVKNNDTMLDAITIKSNESNLTPTIYLNKFYEAYQDGQDMMDILADIAKIHMDHAVDFDVNISSIVDFDNVQDKIICKLVNMEANEKLLSDRPFTQVEDLAVTYHILIDKVADETATIPINNSLMKMFDVPLEELHNIALENTERLLPVTITPMSEVISEMKIQELLSFERMSEEEAREIIEGVMQMTGDCPLYVVSNDSKIDGATAILYSDVLDQIAEKLGEDFYVLPSSIHEALVISKSDAGSREEMQAMVQEVNANEVKPGEILSNYVYEYDSQAHELFRADKAEERQAKKEKEMELPKEQQKEEKRERVSLKEKLPEMKEKAAKVNVAKDVVDKTKEACI